MAPLKLPKSETDGTDPPRMSVLMETEETVETVEVVLVKMTDVGPL